MSKDTQTYEVAIASGGKEKIAVFASNHTISQKLARMGKLFRLH